MPGRVDAPHRMPLIAILALGLSLTLCQAVQPHAIEAERIADLMGLHPGMHVADVGAGNGEWSEDLARAVGETGHVTINEIDPDGIARIRERIEESGLSNMSVVEGTPTDTMLPEGCCDAILLRLVYHHFSDPEAMRASLRSALRPGGLLLVIEQQEEYGHEIRPDTLIAEMLAEGFQVVTQEPDWDDDGDRYCVLFRLPLETAVRHDVPSTW